MKTKEFIKRVEELGCDIKIGNVFVSISYDDYTFIRIDKRVPYIMNTEAAFDVNDAKEFFDLCVEYARTPIEEREDEEKFYLQKIETFYDEEYDEEFAYLNFDVEENTFYLSNKSHSIELKTQFTQKEIDKIKEEQHTDLSEFKQIPVEEIEAE